MDQVGGTSTKPDARNGACRDPERPNNRQTQQIVLVYGRTGGARDSDPFRERTRRQNPETAGRGREHPWLRRRPGRRNERPRAKASSTRAPGWLGEAEAHGLLARPVVNRKPRSRRDQPPATHHVDAREPYIYFSAWPPISKVQQQHLARGLSFLSEELTRHAQLI